MPTSLRTALLPLLLLFALSHSAPVGHRRAPAPWLSSSGLPAAARANLRPTSRQVAIASPYKVTARPVPYPTSQPARARQQVLGLLVIRNSYTEAVNTATMTCMAAATATLVTDWGMWSADQFTRDIIQAEFYCNLVERAENADFPARVRDYVADAGVNGLMSCVRGRGVRLEADASFELARAPQDRDDLPFVSTEDGGGPSPYIPLLLVGVVGFACLALALVVARREARRTFEHSDYPGLAEKEAEVEDGDLIEEDMRVLAH